MRGLQTQKQALHNVLTKQQRWRDESAALDHGGGGGGGSAARAESSRADADNAAAITSELQRAATQVYMDPCY